MPFVVSEGSIGALGIRRIKRIIVSFSMDLDRIVELNNEHAILIGDVIYDIWRDLSYIADIAIDLDINMFDECKIIAVSNALEILRENTETRIDILMESSLNGISNNTPNANETRMIAMEHMCYNMSISCLKMEFAIVQCALLMDLFQRFSHTQNN